jgi:hypothetical protein
MVFFLLLFQASVVCVCPLAGTFLPSKEHLVFRLSCIQSCSQHFIRKAFKECAAHILEAVLTTLSLFCSHVFLSTEALVTQILSLTLFL